MFIFFKEIFEDLGRVQNKVLVVSPLNAIMEDQCKKLNKINVKVVQLSQKCQIIENNKDSCENGMYSWYYQYVHDEYIATKQYTKCSIKQ